MKTFGYAVVILSVIGLLLFPLFWAFGSERDQWEIDIAEAAVWCAQNQFPALDADQFKFAVKPPEAHDATDSTDATGGVSSNTDGRSETSPPIPADSARQDVANETSQTSPVVPMKLTLESPVQSAGPTFPRAQLIVETTTHCPSCERQKNRIVDELTPRGWKIGSNADDHIQIVLIASGPDQTYPTSRLYQRGELIQEWSGYTDPATLSHALRRAWDSAGDQPQQNVATAGYGGSLHGRRQIVEALAWWRQNIGIVPVDFSWKRTGGQTFPLLHQKPDQWTCLNIMGTLGEFSIEAPGSKLPIQPITLGYRRGIDGNMLLRGEVLIHESQLGFPGDGKPSQATFSAQPAGLGPMTILTIASTIQALWQVLHPSVDLTLGGTVSAMCKLDEQQDKLTIEFRDCPSIRVQAWFTFDLKAKRLVIEPTNIHLDVDGSRFVKSRDIRVEE